MAANEAPGTGLLITFALIAAILLSALAVWNGIRDAARKKREIGYTTALKAYSKAIHPGMTRKEVEEYLRSENTQFSWVYTAFEVKGESQYADIVKIGGRACSRYCSEAYVYVALEFSPRKDFEQTATDILQRIEIFRPYSGCL